MPRNRAGWVAGGQQRCRLLREKRRLTGDGLGVAQLPVRPQLDTLHADATEQRFEQRRLADVYHGILATVDPAWWGVSERWTPSMHALHAAVFSQEKLGWEQRHVEDVLGCVKEVGWRVQLCGPA